MRSRTMLTATGGLATCALGLAGCAGRSAPTLSLFGAYFPVWILCGILGVLAALATRLILVASGLAEMVPMQLLFCAAAGLIIASLCWLGLGQ